MRGDPQMCLSRWERCVSVSRALQHRADANSRSPSVGRSVDSSSSGEFDEAYCTLIADEVNKKVVIEKENRRFLDENSPNSFERELGAKLFAASTIFVKNLV